jgi:ribonucleotide reductase alpha subunit
MDYSKDALLSDAGLRILKDRYLTDEENSPQEAFYRASKTFSDDTAMADRIYSYASNLWFMFSTPILTNGGTKRGMPISCFLNYVPDSRIGLTEHYTENAWLATVGGGIGGHWGHVRSDGSETSGGSISTGSIPFMHVVDSEMLAFSQGKTRRGSYAAYQDISHPEIEEFIEMRKPSGGDVHRKCLNLHHGINISDKFMSVIDNCTIDPSADDTWELVDPHTGKIVRNGRTIIKRSKTECDWWHLIQTLTGDSVDNFSGCPKIGIVTAQKILKDKKLPIKKQWDLVIKAYAKEGLQEHDALQQARVARILRHGEYNKQTHEVTQWQI